MSLKISPSILSADFANLESEVKKISKSGVDYIHIDVMDGNFVPNLTLGPPIIKSIRKHSSIPFDVHLMINNPENYIDDYVDAGADIITFHYEATKHVDRLINQIKSKNVKVGISILPSTNEDILNYILEKIDLVLVMTVNPGFGGQEFISSQIQKIKNIRQMISSINKDIILSVDGGINDITAKLVYDAGADMVISGSYIFSDPDKVEEKIYNLKSM